MWFGVLISCTILMGDAYEIHCNSVGVDKLYLWIITEYSLKDFQKCILQSFPNANSATCFLTKSYRISIETSWFLKFKVWHISVCINCNFSRHLDQMSHRDNQPLLFVNLFTWYEVWICTTDIPLAEEVYFWHH